MRQPRQEELDSIVEALMLVEDENFLRQEVLVPILSAKFGPSRVQDVHGPAEHGVDIVCSDVSRVPGRTELIGVVVKAGQVGVGEARETVGQARQALGGNYEIPGQSPARDRCRLVWVVAVGHWTDPAQGHWKEQEGQHDFRLVELLTIDEVAQLVCNSGDKSVQDKLLQKVGLWQPVGPPSVEPSDLPSILTLLAAYPQFAALRAVSFAVTHWSTNDTPKAMEALRGALQNRDVPFVAKRLLLGWLAEHPSIDSAVQSLVQEVLEDAVLARHFLAQMHDSPEWLKVMSPVFKQLAQEGPTGAQRTLGHTVARVCKNEHDLAVSFLRLLWPTQDQGVALGCIRIIEELSLWEEIEDLLEQAAEQWSPILSFMPFALMQALRRGQVGANFASKSLAKWTLSQMREAPVGGPHFRDSLRHAFGDVVEKQPDLVLPHGVEVVEANCEAGKQLGDELHGLKDTDLRVALQFRIDVRGSREEPALVVLTAFLQLAEAGIHVAELGAEIEKLLESEYTAARAIGIKVCRANPKEFVPQCVTALTDWRNLVSPLGDLSRLLLAEAYHLLGKKEQEEVSNVLISLASTTEGEGYEGVSRLRALKSIPEERRTEDVKAEIIRLLEENERLRDIDFAPEPEMHMGFQPAPVSDIAKQIPSMTVQQIIELLHEAEKSDTHDFDRYDITQKIKARANSDCEFALEIAAEFAVAPVLARRYAAELLWAIREAHAPEDRMEAVWRLGEIDDPGVHGIAADIIERSVPDLSGEWVDQARLLLHRWATDPEPEPGSEDSETELLQVGINSARGRVAEALLRVAGEHGLTPETSEVLRQLAEDGSPAVRACVLAKLGHLLPKYYDVSLDLFARATECEDDRVLQYAIWCARYVKPADYRQYVAPVIRRAVASSDEQAARTGGLLAAWWLIGAPKAHPELEETLIDTQQSAVLRGAEEVFSFNVYSQDEAIAQAS